MDELARAIRTSLQTGTVRRVLHKDLTLDAGLARKQITIVMDCVERLYPSEPSARQLVALKLLRASGEAGHSICALLESNPEELSAIAQALQRIQIEQFLRALWVLYCANEETFDDFLQNDFGPRTKLPTGKLKTLSNKDLCEMVADPLLQLEGRVDNGDEKASDWFQRQWKDLSDFVHGGRAAISLYRLDAGKIRCSMNPLEFFKLTMRAVGTTNFSLPIVASMQGIGPHDEGIPMILEAGEAFSTYLVERQRRLLAAGVRVKSLL